MRALRPLTAGLCALAATGALTVGTASAQSRAGDTATAAPACPYPYVCLYKNDARIGMFQDVTSGYQNLPSKPSGPGLRVVNTRHDDVAYFRHDDGTVVCVAPQSGFRWLYEKPALTGIRISSSSTCA